MSARLSGSHSSTADHEVGTNPKVSQAQESGTSSRTHRCVGRWSSPCSSSCGSRSGCGAPIYLRA
jgi:hypothetical protein